MDVIALLAVVAVDVGFSVVDVILAVDVISEGSLLVAAFSVVVVIVDVGFLDVGVIFSVSTFVVIFAGDFVEDLVLTFVESGLVDVIDSVAVTVVSWGASVLDVLFTVADSEVVSGGFLLTSVTSFVAATVDVGIFSADVSIVSGLFVIVAVTFVVATGVFVVDVVFMTGKSAVVDEVVTFVPSCVDAFLLVEISVVNVSFVDAPCVVDEAIDANPLQILLQILVHMDPGAAGFGVETVP